MAMNPMQKRARNSFLAGFLIALIIGAVGVGVLVMKVKNVENEKAKLQALQKKVYVAADDLESGQTITQDSLELSTVQTTVDIEEMVSADDFTTSEDDGTETTKELAIKIDLPRGSIVTKNMLVEVGEQTTADQRIQEYNMILLPSQLEEGDYVDIRLGLPRGEDYIVLSKKKVIKTTATGIWLKLGEEEILTLGNAIVEAYISTGSKLYAIEYTEPGLQEKAEPTYPVSAEVLSILRTSPNVREEAREALVKRYTQDLVEQRNNHINPALTTESEQIESTVESKIQEENTKVQAARAEYVSSLDTTSTSSEY